MSRSIQKILLSIIIILSITLQPPSTQAMDPLSQYPEQRQTTLSPLLQIFLTLDLNDHFKGILGQLNDSDMNSLLIASAKHNELLPLRRIIIEILGEKCAGWSLHDLDSDELSPFSYAPYIARSFYSRLTDLIKAEDKQIESLCKSRQSLLGFLNSLPSLQNHPASYYLQHWDDDDEEGTLHTLANQGNQGAFEIFFLLYVFAKQTPIIPNMNDDPYSQIRIVGIMSHANLINNHALKQSVLSKLDADQSIMLGERFTLHKKDDYLSYLDQYQLLYDARQCFLHAQNLIQDKIRFATLSQYIGDTYFKEANVLKKQGSLESALESYQKALHYFFQPEPKLDSDEKSDQGWDLLKDFRYSNYRAIYKCLKEEAKLFLKTHQKIKALNNFKLARKMFSFWVDEEDSLINTSDKLTALQNSGICYVKEGIIHQLMENDIKALSNYKKARNLFQRVIMARPDFNATILEYHLADCHKHEGTIYYRQGRLFDASYSYNQAQIYFTDALKIRVILPNWKAQYGIASCLIKQKEIRRLLGKENETRDLRDIKKALVLLTPIIKLLDHPELRKKAGRLFNACVMDIKERDINIKGLLGHEEG